jgi:crotonobetainyl-CoA:carnitine CoA-transferase CaiB-like acyl-CoA transferase
MANSGDLTAILNEVFATQPMSHWQEVFDQAHLTFGVVHAPSEVVKDPGAISDGTRLVRAVGLYGLVRVTGT